MSLDAQDWVWEHSQAKGTARIVLLAIADKASGANCQAYAGTTMLVKRSKAARSSVVVAVDKLIDIGELAIVEGQKGPGGETVYTLPLARGHVRELAEGGPKTGPVQNPDRSENRTPGGPKTGPPRSENRTPTGPKTGPQNTRNAGNTEGTQTTDGEQSSLHGDLHLDAGNDATADRDYAMTKFGAFWLVYPRSKQREKAKQAWRDAIDRGADPDHIVKSATAYANERANEDPKYTPFPATWLDRGSYDDEPDAERPALQAVSGGWAPYTNPVDQSVYKNRW